MLFNGFIPNIKILNISTHLSVLSSIILFY